MIRRIIELNNFKRGDINLKAIYRGEILIWPPLPTGTLLIGGFFNSYNEFTANRIISLNLDGSVKTTFGQGFTEALDSFVATINDTYIGGTFTTYQGVSANRIIRLNLDGSRDTAFDIGTGFNSSVNAIQIQSDNKIIVGGGFTTYQGVSANRIIRLNPDGSRDTTFDIGTGFSGSTNAIQIQSDGKIIVGGNFVQYQGISPGSRIIRLNPDGSRDTTFDMGTGFDSGSAVFDIQIQSDAKIIVGGSFIEYQGVSANRIIRLNANGSRDTTFDMGTGFNNIIRDIKIQSDGKIIVGGFFTIYQGVSVNRIIRLNPDGSRDTTFDIGTGFETEIDPALQVVVFAISIQSDNKIIVGGGFTFYKGVSANRIIRLNPDGSRDTTFDIGTGFNSQDPNRSVRAIQIIKDTDPDAKAFLLSAEITDQTITNAINDLVVDLKIENIWDKFIAIYPFVGDTATTHKWNLKNPVNTDAAFRLSFFGGLTHNSNGVTGNGSDAYYNTHIIPLNNLQLHNASGWVYSRTNTTSGVDFGILRSSLGFHLNIRNANSNMTTRLNSTGLITTSNTSSTGLFGFSRDNSSSYYKFIDGTINTVTNDSNLNLANGEISGLALYGVNAPIPNVFSNRNHAFLAIGESITINQATQLKSIIDKFQTKLNRQV